MGPRIPRADSGLKGIIKTIWALAGLVVVALVLGVLDLVLTPDGGCREAGVGRPAIWAVGFFRCGSCAALCCSARRLAARLKRAFSDPAPREAQKCRWYRKQRHAFCNHMQIVSGLLALKRFDDAREYIARIADSLEADDTAQFDKSCPELDDTLCRRIEAGRSRGSKSRFWWDPAIGCRCRCWTPAKSSDLRSDSALDCAVLCGTESVQHYRFQVSWFPDRVGTRRFSHEQTEAQDAAAHIAAVGRSVCGTRSCRV